MLFVPLRGFLRQPINQGRVRAAPARDEELETESKSRAHTPSVRIVS